LPAAHREIIDLVYYHGRSIEEIARIIGVPRNTVKTRTGEEWGVSAMSDSVYLDRAAACMLAALQVRDPVERKTLLHIAQAYLRRSERTDDEQDDPADKLWTALSLSQGSQASN
jgi:hypothetical protein